MLHTKGTIFKGNRVGVRLKYAHVSQDKSLGQERIIVELKNNMAGINYYSGSLSL